jgi:hypothetical protein
MKYSKSFEVFTFPINSDVIDPVKLVPVFKTVHLGNFLFSSIVAEFDLWLRVKINCVLDFEEEVAEAKEVLFQVDELNAAMNLRIGLEEEKETEASGIYYDLH